MDVSLGLAFIAGLASFLSPCVLSLVPVYISYLSGRSIALQQSVPERSRLEIFLHGVAFVFGFSLVFVVLGMAVSALSMLLYDAREWIARIGGIIVIIFGLHITGILRISVLEYDLRPRSRLEENRSYLSSALLGIFFSAGWSPCVGPVLGPILTLAMNEGSFARGTLLLCVYSAGLAIPFLAASLGIDWVTRLLRGYGKVIRGIEIGMGVVLIFVGVLLFLGVFQEMARIGLWFDFGV